MAEDIGSEAGERGILAGRGREQMDLNVGPAFPLDPCHGLCSLADIPALDAVHERGNVDIAPAIGTAFGVGAEQIGRTDLAETRQDREGIAGAVDYGIADGNHFDIRFVFNQVRPIIAEGGGFARGQRGLSDEGGAIQGFNPSTTCYPCSRFWHDRAEETVDADPESNCIASVGFIVILLFQKKNGISGRFHYLIFEKDRGFFRPSIKGGDESEISQIDKPSRIMILLHEP